MQLESVQQHLPILPYTKHWPKGRPRRGKSKVMEQIDLFLEGLGLYRKQTARDATCLFRAVSEQIFYSQCFHYSVRLSCIHFMERNPALFPSKIDGENFDDHVRRLRSPREWGGRWEMQAMSILYKRDFIMFNDINTVPLQMTDNHFHEKIMLCRIGPNHFDSVFSKSFIDDTALCQGLIYDMLYGDVYGMEDIDTAIQVMLYEGKSKVEPNNQISIYLRENDRPNSVVNILLKGGTPFPYKVAKALDPMMYRNVEYDLWNDERKEMKRSSVFHNEILQVGSKCLVTMNGNRQYPAYIQDMMPNKGPVSVFVEVLGEKCVVPYENIEPIILPPTTKTRCICISGTIQQPIRYNKRNPHKQSVGRIYEQKNLREITNGEKFKCTSTPNSKAQIKDVNNNVGSMEKQVVLWNQNTFNPNELTLATFNLSNSLESQESTDSDSPGSEVPLYMMAPQSQWGSYPSVPPCGPPPSPQQQSMGPYPTYSPSPCVGPTPVYVTFSDGTTVLVPSHRADPNLSSPVIFFDPASPSPPMGHHYSMIEHGEMDHPDVVNISMEQVIHDLSRSSLDRSSFEGFPPSMPPLGFWTEQAPVLPGSFGPPPLSFPNPQVVNGEMGPMTVYFSPPFPYHMNPNN